MRVLIRRFDAFLRQANGVFEFCDEANCVLRLQLTSAPHALCLDGHMVNAGESVLGLHLWNEHIPPLPPGGPDLAWATCMRRLLIRSFRAVAWQMGHDPRLAGVRAVGGIMALLSPIEHPGGVHLLERLGFSVLPYHSPLGRFGEFWENLYSWWIMWAFNAVSLRTRQLIHMRRTQVWMLKVKFLNWYGAD